MNKKVKLLLTIPNFDTAGSGKSVYDIVNRIDRSIFEPHVCCFHDRGELFEALKALDVKIHLFNFTENYRPFLTFPFRVFKIVKFFKTHKFDLIYSWHWSSDFSEPLAAKLAKIPYIYSKKAMGWGNKAWTWRSKLSTKVVVVNEEMKSAFFTGMEDKVVQIPLAVDINRFTPLKKTYTVPTGQQFKEDDFIIVSVANLVPVKGIEILLDAVNQLNDSSIKVLIVGDANNDYGAQLISDYKGHDHIFFLGKHLDVRPFLAVANLFVIPTKDEGRREGLPIAPMEAMASGRIVLGSDITGVREVLKAFPNCQFEPSNVDDLSHKIKTFRDMSQNDRDQLAKDMRSYVEQNLSVKIFMDMHEDLFKAILKID
ncbi:glycosyltransferase [uncultured Psychroserpens sp.]|uniref:glycosyltransferase n=1 Tax=uncultured Psychroserpens sp. TaxID=255436 RepID=UPI0026051837|nr:glycosyltransferase [uncultured Psychroserpens sp.]